MNIERLEKTLEIVNQFGFTDEGMNRLAYTESEQQAVQYLVELFEQEGMTVKIDAAGNVIARREGMDSQLPAVVCGSHIDTVYNGGKYDGTLGVVAGLEVIRTLNEKEITTKHPIEIIIFACEESARFGVSTIGSMAMIGEFQDAFLRLKDKEGISLQTAMEQCNLNPRQIERAYKSPKEVKVFYELHVEQGPVLEREQKQIGIVTGIAAPTRFHVQVRGESAHSGTTPMELRKDAFLGASEIALALEEAAICEKKYGTVATVGTCEVSDGAMNVVPGKVDIAIDIRSISMESKNRVIEKLYDVITSVKEKRQLSIDVKKLYDERPVKIKEKIVQTLVDVTESLNMSYLKMPSGAGHDAMMMAKAYPTGIIFVPSKDGLSHNKDEFTSMDQIADGVRLLQEVILREALIVKQSYVQNYG